MKVKYKRISRHVSTYGFVVDTDTYAGSFERELVAHMTGQVGDCGIGDELGEKAQEDLKPKHLMWFEDHVSPQVDEHGCSRPARIFKSPGNGKNNSAVCWLDKAPPQHIMDVMMSRAVDFFVQNAHIAGPNVKIIGYRVIRQSKSIYERVVASSASVP